MSDLKVLLERADRAVADVPLPADGLEGLERRRERKQRNRRIRAGAVAVIVALVTGIALFRSVTSAPIPANPPVKPPPAPVGTLGDASESMLDLRTGKLTPLPASIAIFSNSYAVSPDHKMIALVDMRHTADRSLFTANIDGRQLNGVSATDGVGFAPGWSPDGSMLVYQLRDNFPNSHPGSLIVYDVATGQRTTVANLDQTHSWGLWAMMLPSFAPDGTSILFQLPRDSQTDDLWSVPVTGGTPTLVRSNAASGSYSPDGRWLAYLSPGREPNGLWITGVQGGTPRLVAQGFLSWPRWSPDAMRISYSENGSIYVLDVATGVATHVAEGGNAEWFDNDTLIVAHSYDGPRG